MDERKELVELKAAFQDKTILVIGGTGTIGRRIVDILLRCEPRVIRVLSRDESKQFEMQHDYDEPKRLRFLIGDVRDCDRMEKACRGVDAVFHLAAMKHVPACEYDTFDAVRTNVLGTQNVIQAAIKCGVKRVVFTSTDKAISPTNVMGATKLLAERLIATSNYNQGPIPTVFCAVRFGNVMGSRGSVIPLFKKQILERRRITVTNNGMTRFMMSITDAALLTLKAATLSGGGEIFVLKMPVVKLKDLAEVVVEEVCAKHGLCRSDIATEYIGLRFGEKMYEELMTEEESKTAFELPDMFAITQPFYEARRYERLAQRYPRAKIGVYSSRDQRPLDKEAVRRLIMAENLI